jgi:hypothetical protein
MLIGDAVLKLIFGYAVIERSLWAEFKIILSTKDAGSCRSWQTNQEIEMILKAFSDSPVLYDRSKNAVIASVV